MKLERVIAAIALPDREGLELAATRLDGPEGTRLLLEAGEGAAILELFAQEGFFVFAHGKARLVSAGDEAGRAFVDAVGQWLGLKAQAEPRLDHVDELNQVGERSNGEAECSWVRLGAGQDPFGVHWDAFKLFFGAGARYAEVFFRLSEDTRRAQLLEKWSRYRTNLVEIFNRALAGPAPRTWGPVPPSETPARDEPAFGDADRFEAAPPEGWRVTWREEGHWRMTDREGK